MGTIAQPRPVSRDVVEAFYEAYARGDVARIALFLADDVHWTINGPVDLLHFCGTRYGKEAVLDMIVRLVPTVFRITGFARETLLVDGDRASTLNRLSARREDGRRISYRVAQFLRFRDDKVVDYCSVIDSFDAAEQVLGHRILPGRSMPTASGDVIAV